MTCEKPCTFEREIVEWQTLEQYVIRTNGKYESPLVFVYSLILAIVFLVIGIEGRSRCILTVGEHTSLHCVPYKATVPPQLITYIHVP